MRGIPVIGAKLFSSEEGLLFRASHLNLIRSECGRTDG